MTDGVAKAILMPLDLRSLMASTMLRIDPACIILIEAELWPQLLHTAKRHHIPVIVVSGKISDRTNRRLSTLRLIANEILPFVTHYFVQDSRTEGRLRAFGVAPTQNHCRGQFEAYTARGPDRKQSYIIAGDKFADARIWQRSS